ncbi:MAG TPA: hypothetical protein VNO14_13170 [Blastocatellia bacterium]|nr:hypothetical protein [Blastocatellia bacterium]
MITTKRVIWAIVFCAAAVTAAGAYRERASTVAAPAAAQDPIQLDRRISLLEQRLYSIESRISSVERQALAAQRTLPSQTARDPFIEVLRNEVESLKLRLREVECGLVHVDERTLSQSAKEARKRAGGQVTDPCRLNPETPVKLPGRQ